jgi:hypothetical protein
MLGQEGGEVGSPEHLTPEVVVVVLGRQHLQYYLGIQLYIHLYIYIIYIYIYIYIYILYIGIQLYIMHLVPCRGEFRDEVFELATVVRGPYAEQYRGLLDVIFAESVLIL